MTKEEKEAVLHCLRAMIDEEFCEECPLYGTTGTDHREKDCVRLAIEELEQKPCEDCCNGNQEEKAKLCQKSYLAGMEHKQEPFADTILTLTKQVVTQVTEDMDNFIFTTIKPWCEAKEQREISKRDLEQALTQYFSKEPCEDCISRQAAIDTIESWLSCDDYNEAERHIMRAMQSVLYDLPFVNPQKPICPSEGVDPAYEKTLNKWIGAEVLDRIRNEMHATAEKHEDGVYYLRDEWVDEIIDKYAEGSDKE